MDRTKFLGAGCFTIYLGAIVAANWLIKKYGIITIGGLSAPAGVFAAGLTFPMRDMTQRCWGWFAGISAIVLGAGLTFFISPALAIASGVTFLISESLDWSIYTPLQKRFTGAVVLSSVFAAIVDSLIFLRLAHIPYTVALPGQIVFKLLIIFAVGLPSAVALRRLTLAAA